MSVLDKFLVIDERCSVTAFDMHVQVHRDGRERGLWVRLNDTSAVRREMYKQWCDDAVGLVARLMDFDENKSKKFRLFMSMNSEFERMTNSRCEEAALLEWDELERVHKAIGAELKKRKENT